MYTITYYYKSGTQETTVTPTNAWDYEIYATISSDYHNEFTTEKVAFTIEKMTVSLSWKAPTNLYYDGTAKVPTLEVYNIVKDADVSATIALTEGKDNVHVGSFTFTATGLTGADSANYKLPDNVTSDVYTIIMAQVAKPVEDTTVFTYNGNEQTYTLAENENYTITGNKQTNAGTYTVTVALNNPSIYSWEGGGTDNLSYSFVIGQVELTFTGFIDGKVYDGTTKGTGKFTFTGAVNGETPTATGTFTWTSKNAGTQTYNVTDVTLTGISATNYKLATTSGSWNSGTKIEKKTLTVTWSAKTFTYNGTRQGPTTFSDGLIFGDTLGTSFSGYEINAGTYTVIATIDNNNYQLSEDRTEYVIEKATLTPTAAIVSKRYNRNTSGSGTITLAGAQNGELPEATGTFTWQSYNAGETKFDVTNIALTTQWTTNYKLSTDSLTNQTTEGQQITLGLFKINWNNMSVTYNGNPQSPQVSASNYWSGDSLELEFTIEGEHTNVGDYQVTVTAVTGTGSENYELPAERTNTFTITPVLVNKPTAASGTLTYKGTSQVIIYYAQDKMDFVKNAGSESISYDNSTIFGFNAGTYTLTFTPKANHAWSDGTRDEITLTKEIQQAPLTATGSSHTVTYGDAAPSYTIEYSGFVNNEDENKFTSKPSISCAYTSTSATGEYDVVVSGGAAKNYAFTYVKGTVKVKSASLTVTTTYYSGVYDGNAHTGSVSVTAVNNQSCTVKYGTVLGGYTLDSAPTRTDVTDIWIYYFITAPNHESRAGQFKITITAKEVTLNWGTTTFTYNRQEQCPTATAGGLIGSDVCTVTVTGGQTNAGNHTATATALSNSNYKLPAAKTAAFTISPVELTPTFAINSKTYNRDTDGTGTVTLSGAVEGDNPTATGVFTWTSRNAGTTTFNVTITLAEAYATNYTLSATSFENQTTEGAQIDYYELTILWKVTEVRYKPIDGQLAGEPQSPEVTVYSYMRGDGISLIVEVSGEHTNVGTYIATVTGIDGTGKDNYVLPSDPAQTTHDFVILPALLDKPTPVSGDMTYNGSERNIIKYDWFKVNLSNAVKDLSQPSISSSYWYIMATYAGTYSVSFKPKSNFVWSDTETTEEITVTKVIQQAPITATGSSHTVKYGDADPSYTIEYNGFVKNEDESVFTTTPSISCDYTNESVPGSYDVDVSGGVAKNYAFTYVKGTVTVEKADLTVTTTNYEGVYDGLHHTGSVSATAVNNQTVTIRYRYSSDAEETYTHTLPQQDYSAGTHEVWFKITADYHNDYMGSILIIISQRVAELEWENTTFTYNGQEQCPTATVKNLTTKPYNKDEQDICTVTVTGGQTNAGNYTATATALSNSNYKLPDEVTTSFTINKASLTPNWATITSKTYDGTTKGTGKVTFSGAVEGETPTATGTFTWATKNAEEKTFSVTNIKLASQWTTNYELSTDSLLNYHSAATKIWQKEVTITWGETTLTYNGQEQCPTATVNELIDGDVCTVTVTGGQKNAGIDYTATATALSDSNYTFDSKAILTTQFTINQKGLDVSGIIDSKVYDGTTDGTGTVTLSGAAEGEEPTARGTFIWENKNAGTTGFSASGIELDSEWTTNYYLCETDFVSSGENSITQREIGIGWIEPENLIYDKTAKTPRLDLWNVVAISENPDGETVFEDVELTIKLTDGKDNINVGKFTFEVTGIGNPNYMLPTGEGSMLVSDEFEIAPRVVTIESWTAPSELVYDKTAKIPTAVLNGAVGDDTGVIAGDTVNVTGAPTGDCDNVNVGTFTFTATGLDNKNYVLSEEDENLVSDEYTITARIVTLTWTAPSDLVYDKTEKIPTPHVSNVIEGDDVQIEGVAAGDNVNVGKFTYTATQLGNPNYTLPAEVTSDEYEITPREVELTWDLESKVVYDGTPQIPVAILNNVIEGDVVNAIGALASGDNINVGKFTYTATGLDNNNYTLAAEVTSGECEIVQRELTLIWTAPSDLVYDKTAKTPSATAGNVVEGDTVTVTAVLTEGKDNVNVGSFTFTATELDNDNYKLPIDVISGEYTITAREVTLVWTAPSDLGYDGNAKVPTVEADNVVEGDTVTVTAVLTEGKDNVNVGSFTYTATELNGESKSNYKLPTNATSGEYTITARVVTLTWTAPSDLGYDGNEKVPTVAVGNIIDGETVNVTIALTTDNDNVNVGSFTYTATELIGASKSNYELPTNAISDEYTITAREVTLTWTPLTSLVYDGTAKVLTAKAGNIVGSDKVNVTAKLTDGKDNVNVGSFTYTATELTGADSANYKLPTNATSDDFEITARVVTLTWTAPSNLVYDKTAKTPTATAGNLLGGDTVNVSIALTTDNDNVNVGTFTFTAIALDNANYKLSEDEASITSDEYTITAREVTLEWTAPSNLAYDKTEKIPTATAGNLLDGDAAAVSVELASGSNVNVGSFTFAAIGLNNDNYKLPSNATSGEYTITAREVTLTWTAPSDLVYDKTAKTPTVVANVVGGDTVNVTIVLTPGKDNKNVGKFTFTAIGLSNTNYVLSTNVISDEYEITARVATLVWGTTTFTYDGKSHCPTATIGNLAGGDICTVTVTGSGTNAGDYTATAQSLSNSNYQLPDDNEKSFTIERAKVQKPAAVSETLTYTGKAQSIITGYDSVKMTASVTGGASLNGTAYQATNAGEYSVAFTPTSNYRWGDKTVAEVTLTKKIEKAELTVTGSSHTLFYGEAAPKYTVSYSGFVNDETEGALSKKPTATSTYTTTSAVGSYPVTVSGGEATNYTFIYVAGEVTVNEEALKVTVEDYTGAYDGQPHTGKVVVVTDDGETATVRYGTISGTYHLTSAPTFTSVSENTVYFEITADNHTPKTGSFKVTITKAINEWVVQPSVTSPAYGTAITVKGESKFGYVTVKYTGRDETEYVESTTKPTKTGSYTATFSVSDTTNYSGLSETVDFTIGQATVEKPAVVSEKLTYTGKAQNIITGYDGTKMTGEGVTSGASLNGTVYQATKAGTYSVTFTLAPNYRWKDGTTTDVTLTKTIEKITLTPSAVIDAKTYDGTTAGTGTITLEGAVNSENPTATGSFAWTDKSAGTKTFNVTVTLNSSYNTNYQLSETSLTNQSSANEIEKKEVTLVWGKTTFTYNGQVQCPTVTVSGFVGDETCAVEVTGGETNAGNYTATASEANDQNYKLPASHTKAFSISKITLTVGGTVDAKQYDGTTAATGTITLTGAVDGEKPTAKGDFGWTDRNAGTRTFNVLNIALDGQWNDNYQLSNANLLKQSGASAITPREVTLVWGTLQFTYNGTNQCPTATAEGLVDGDTCAVTVTGGQKDAGSHTATASEVNSKNYTLPEQNTAVYVISKATLTVTGSSHTVTYGDETPNYRVTYVGFVRSETESVLSQKPTATCEYTTSSAAGHYPVTVSGGEATNYDFIYVVGTVTVCNAAVKVTANGYTGAYDGQPHTGKVDVPKDGTDYTITYGETAGVYDLNSAPEYTNVSTYTVYYLVSAENHKDVTGTFTVTITQITLTVTGSTHTVTYGDEVPTYTVSYSGFVSGENENVLTTKPEATSEYTATSAVGSYLVTVSEGEATNYNFRYVRGKVTVENATMTEVSANNYSGTYDGTAHTGSVSATTVNGLAYTVKYGTASGKYSMTDIPKYTNAGEYTVYYRVTAPNHTEETGSYTVTIARVTLTVGGIIQSKSYDGKTTGSGSVTLEGAVNGENPTATGTFVWTDKSAGTTSFNVTNIVLGSGFKTNYQLSATDYQGSGENTITPKTVSLIWGTTKFDYDGQEHCPTATVSGLVSGDSCIVTITGGQTNAGSHTATAEALDNSNYQLSASITKAFTITRIKLTVTGSTHTVTYGEEAPSYQLTYSGFVNGEDESKLDVAPTPTSAYTSTSNVGSYPVTLSGGVSTNYEFSYVSGKVTVVNATMTVTSQDYTGIYDGIAHTGSVNASTVNGQTFTVKYGTASGKYSMTEIPKYTNAGEYTVYYQVTAPNHEAVTGSYTVTIGKADIDADGITLEDMRVTFDTQSHFIVAQDVPQGLLVRYEENGQTNVGVYTVRAIFTGNSSNYNSFNKTMTATLTIDSAKVEKPEAYTGEFVHNGEEQTYPIDLNPAYKVSGYIQKLAGDYTVTVALASSNYVWSDGTTDNLTFAFKIKSSTLDTTDSEGKSMATIESENGFADNTSLVVNSIPAGKDGVEQYFVEKYGKDLKKEIETGNGKIKYAYEVHLEQNGVTVQPDGKITVKLFIPEELRESTYQIVHVQSANEHQEVKFRTEGDYAVVEVDSLFDFAFVVNEAGTGLGTGAIVGISVACAVAFALIVFFLIFFLIFKRRKKKEEEES